MIMKIHFKQAVNRTVSGRTIPTSDTANTYDLREFNTENLIFYYLNLLLTMLKKYPPYRMEL